MKDLLEYIVMNLVSKPENVQIDEQRDNGNVNLNLTVDPSDMGLIIGKGGQTIHSIRKLLTVRAMAENVRVNLQLNEPAGGPRVPSEKETTKDGEALDEKAEREPTQDEESPAEEPPAVAPEEPQEQESTKNPEIQDEEPEEKS